jgi:hypothetical protein
MMEEELEHEEEQDGTLGKWKVNEIEVSIESLYDFSDGDEPTIQEKSYT